MNKSWLPISEAPKDGTKILVFGTWEEISTGRTAGEQKEIGVAEWIYEGHKDFMVHGWLNTDGYYEILWEPTHYIKLPETPEND